MCIRDRSFVVLPSSTHELAHGVIALTPTPELKAAFHPKNHGRKDNNHTNRDKKHPPPRNVPVNLHHVGRRHSTFRLNPQIVVTGRNMRKVDPVSYTHLRAHET